MGGGGLLVEGVPVGLGEVDSVKTALDRIDQLNQLLQTSAIRTKASVPCTADAIAESQAPDPPNVFSSNFS